MTRLFLLLTVVSASWAQPLKPVHAQGSSTIDYKSAPDGSRAIEIHNVSYEVATNIPGRPPDELLLLRKTIHSKEILGDIGVEALVMLEAWHLGDDLRQKPLYKVSASGTGGNTRDNALFVVSRGLEEVEWWSVYKLGSGQHLFDTYVPLLSFSIARDTVTMRYTGLEAPADDTTDARLKQPNVVAVLSYASDSRVLREVLLTCDDPQRATLLRSYADVTRTLSLTDGPSRSIKLSFTQNFPSAPNPVEVIIPVAGDDLDLKNAKLPARMHAAGWKR